MVWWGIPIEVIAVAAFIYGIVTHRRRFWVVAGVYIAVSLITFVLLGLGHGGAGYTVTSPSP